MNASVVCGSRLPNSCQAGQDATYRLSALKYVFEGAAGDPANQIPGFTPPLTGLRGI